MHETLTDVCKSLDDLTDSIKNGYSNESLLVETLGWSSPSLNKIDLSEMAENLATKIRTYDIEELDATFETYLAAIPNRIEAFTTHTLPHMFNGNSPHACSSYFSLISWIDSTIQPLFTWESLQDNKMLPNQLTKRLRSIQVELNDIVPEKEALQNQIKIIQDATNTAESLPTDMQALKEARNKIDKFSTDAAELYGKIGIYEQDSYKSSEYCKSKKVETDKIVAQCEEAYKITTTKGLAASFDQRADKLANTMWLWVVGLLLSLVAGAFIGASRFEAMSTLLATKPSTSIIVMEFVLSIIGLAAPIWFAWLATKQISQRFRLAEDYAYKSSVAKAYEGYRKEAARIDEALEARLFSSALTRLEEAPLRLVSDDSHSSPWQEFFSSPAFQNAMDKVPELRDKFVSLASKGIDTIKSINPKKESSKRTDEDLAP